MAKYQVIVGSIGTIFVSRDEHEAIAAFVHAAETTYPEAEVSLMLGRELVASVVLS